MRKPLYDGYVIMCGRGTWKAILVVVMAALAIGAIGQTQPDERGRTFAWFDRLGYTELLKRPFIEVNTYRWSDRKKAKYNEGQRFGFLLSEGKGAITLLDMNLHEQRFSGSLWGGYYWGYKRTSLSAWASAELKQPGYWYERDASLFLASRACALAVEDGLSKKLFAYSLSCIYPTDSPTPKSSADYVADHITAEIMEGIVHDIGDSTQSWQSIRDRVSVVASNGSPCKGTGLAKSFLTVLNRMIEVEARRSKTRILPTHTLDERTEELVYELRTQAGTSFVSPGYCYVFDDPRWDKSPAFELVKIGLPAVPRLIHALGDDSLSRSTAFDMHRSYEESTLRVRDVALQVLNKIANSQFGPNVERPLTDSEALQTKARAARWWMNQRSLSMR